MKEQPIQATFIKKEQLVIAIAISMTLIIAGLINGYNNKISKIEKEKVELTKQLATKTSFIENTIELLSMYSDSKSLIDNLKNIATEMPNSQITSHTITVSGYPFELIVFASTEKFNKMIEIITGSFTRTIALEYDKRSVTMNRTPDRIDFIKSIEYTMSKSYPLIFIDKRLYEKLKSYNYSIRNGIIIIDSEIDQTDLDLVFAQWIVENKDK